MAIIEETAVFYRCNICGISYSVPVAECFNSLDAVHQALEPAAPTIPPPPPFEPPPEE